MLKVEYGKPVIYKDSDVMGTLIFREIDKELAEEMIVNNHYSHKWGANFGKHNIGVFRESDPMKCLGVASFGWMMHPESYKSIADNIEKDELLELNRLWVDDCLGKNTETMLLSASFKILKYYGKIKLIQSFADGRLGCGTIYKASNFKYYGYSENSFLRDKNTGEMWFEQMITNTARSPRMMQLADSICAGTVEIICTKSYRYLYKLDKNVHIVLKELPFPEYSKGSEVIDCETYFTTKNQSILNAVFRSYLVAKFTRDEISAHNIAVKLLHYYTKEEINDIFNDQKENKTLILWYPKESFNYIYNITDWYDLLIKDSNNVVEARPIFETEDLWG